MKVTFACLLFCFVAVVCGTTQNFTLSNDDFAVNVTKNSSIPKYSFHLVESPEDHCVINLEQVRECIGTLAKCVPVPSTSLALASVNWTFTDAVETNESISFSMVGTGTSRFASLSIDNVLLKSGNTTKIKFDVVLTNYTWTSTSSLAKLLVSFYMAGSCNNTYFESDSVAHSTVGAGTPTNVTVAFGSKGSNTHWFLLFSKFPNSATVELDPAFGMTASSDANVLVCIYSIFAALFVTLTF
jgi:hypothetical protein